MLRINLRGQIRQTHLPKWKPLMPLFEAVMNAFQAIQDQPNKANHKIIIEVERDHRLKFEKHPPIAGFSIRDTGIGFNDVNFDSFNTSFSDYKVDRGGKGLGRFMWLRAFDRVEIDSVFSETDSPSLLQRHFTFDANYDPDRALLFKATRAQVGTVVRLFGFQRPYKTECVQSADQIAQQIVEHFLLLFLRPDCPVVEIHDGSVKLGVNSVFSDHYQANASKKDF